MDHLVGIDVGCTNVKALALSGAGKLRAEVSVPTRDDGSGAWVSQVLHAFRKVARKPDGREPIVGVAAPGLAAKDQKSIACMPGRLLGIEGLVWRELFHLVQPVPVLNDAHAALMGECWAGAAKGARNVILLTLGTGVGGAAMVDGQLLRGAIGRAGHLGHISLNPDGPKDVANTPGSLEDAIGDCTVSTRTNGRFESTARLVQAALRGDQEAKRICLVSVKNLAAGIAGLINVLDPEIVVLGGGIAKAGPVLLRPLRKHLESFEWRPGGHRARIVLAELGDRAGAYGAAWNAIQPRRAGRSRLE